MKSSEIKWNQVKSNEIKWKQVKPIEIKRNQIKSNEIKWNQVKSSEIKWNQVKPNETKWNQLEWNKINSNPVKWYETHMNSCEAKWNQLSPTPLPPILISTFSWAYRYLCWLLCLLLGKELINGLTSTSSFAYPFLFLRCPLTWRVGVGPWFILIFRTSLCHAVQFAVCLVCT